MSAVWPASVSQASGAISTDFQLLVVGRLYDRGSLEDPNDPARKKFVELRKTFDFQRLAGLLDQPKLN